MKAAEKGKKHPNPKPKQEPAAPYVMVPLDFQEAESQLELFRYLTPRGYSSTIEVFDAIPKYLHRTEKTTELGTQMREFKLGDKTYTVEITPAHLGAQKLNVFPGPREELVEGAVRKLFIDRIEPEQERKLVEMSNEDGNAAIRFRLPLVDICKELKEHGHEFNSRQVREALDVLSKTLISAKTEDDRHVMGESGRPILNFSYISEKDSGDDRTILLITFHPLIARGILTQRHRAYDFSQEMSLNKPLSRWLFRRMCWQHAGATYGNAYEIWLNVIMRESGMAEKATHEAIRRVIEALTEMQEKGVLFPPLGMEQAWSVEKTYHEASGPGRPKIKNAKFLLYPSHKVVDDIKDVNIKRARNPKLTKTAKGPGVAPGAGLGVGARQLPLAAQ